MSLVLSDVVGNALEVIASGPTAPAPTTAEDALLILDRYGLENRTSATILKALKDRRRTPLTDDNLFSRIHNIVVGSNLIAAQAALKQAADEGFHPYLLRTDLQGEAREAARDLFIQVRWAWKMGDPVPRPACFIAGGETTVTLRGEGHGGRNTELALASGSNGIGLCVASISFAHLFNS